MAKACVRCKEAPPVSVGSLCSLCLGEFGSLRRGDIVEWYHHKAGWRPAKFFVLKTESAELRSDIGCEIYRKLTHIRIPGGRAIVLDTEK